MDRAVLILDGSPLRLSSNDGEFSVRGFPTSRVDRGHSVLPAPGAENWSW